MGNESVGNYTTVQKLGKGIYGKTRLCETTDHFYYAIKIYELQPGKTVPQAIKQLKAANNFSHNGIAKIKDYIELGDNKFGVQMEHYPEGNLTKHLGKDISVCIMEMRRIAEAVRFLHIEKKTPHRDLKPENIFFKEQNILLSDIIPPSMFAAVKLRLLPGGYDYHAPETQMGVFSFSSDIWSLGVIFLEMLIGKRMRQAIPLDKDRPSQSEDYPPATLIQTIQHEDMRHMINKMIDPDPLERIDIKEVLVLLQEANSQKVTTFRKKALNQSGPAAEGEKKHIQEFVFNFDMHSPYISHFNIVGATVRRIDHDNVRYQVHSRESMPSGRWEIVLKIMNYGQNNDEVGIGVLSEQRKDEKTSGDIDQANSVAYWTNINNQKGHLCENGIWKEEDLPFVRPKQGIFRMVVDTVDREIEWYVDDKQAAISYMPKSYWDQELYVFVGLMGYDCTLKFRQRGTFT